MSPAPTAVTMTPGTAPDETAAAGRAALPPVTGHWPTGYHPPSQPRRYDRHPFVDNESPSPDSRFRPASSSGSAQLPNSSSGRGSGRHRRRARPNCPTPPPAAVPAGIVVGLSWNAMSVEPGKSLEPPMLPAALL